MATERLSGTRILLSFAPFFKPYRKRILVWFLIYGSYFLLGVGTPLAVKYYLDDILKLHQAAAAGAPLAVDPSLMGRVAGFAVLYGLYALLMHLFYLVGFPLMQRTIEDMAADLRFAVYEKLHRLSIRYFDRTLSGEIVNQVLQDTRQLLNLVGGDLVQMVLQVGTGLVCLAWLFRWNSRLGTVVVAFLPAYGWLFFKFLPLVRKAARAWRKAEDRMWGNWSEKLTGMAIIQAFARERGEALKHHRFGHASADTWYRMSLFGTGMTVLGGLTAQVSQHAAFALGCLLLVNGELTLGALFSLSGLIGYILAPVQTVFNVINTWQQSTVSAERIQTILQEVEEVRLAEGRRRVGRLQGAVDYVHVFFEYEKNKPVLQDVHFSVQAGQNVALVGHTGCGKSTIVALLAGFYVPQKGSILIDGIPVGEMLPRDLRANIGTVPQDTFLFKDTLRANIAYGRPAASDAEIRRVLQAAQLEDFTAGLPQGWDTRLGGEEGISPSQGEAQRIAIARALLIDPAIVVLDEATSSLDSLEEARLQQAIGELLKRRTAFIIAHRLSTIRQCDAVILMERGQLVEMGHPERLLADPESAYSKLHKAHFSQAPRD